MPATSSESAVHQVIGNELAHLDLGWNCFKLALQSGIVAIVTELRLELLHQTFETRDSGIQLRIPVLGPTCSSA